MGSAEYVFHTSNEYKSQIYLEHKDLIKAGVKIQNSSPCLCKPSLDFNILSYRAIFIFICHKGIGDVVYLDVF